MLILNNAFTAQQITARHLSIHDSVTSRLAKLSGHSHAQMTVLSLSDGNMLWINLAVVVSFVNRPFILRIALKN